MTPTALFLWLLLPAGGIAWLYSVIGPDPRLVYLAAVTILPAGLVLLARGWAAHRQAGKGGNAIE